MNHWPASSSSSATAAAAATPEDEPLLAKPRMKTKSITELLAKLETSHEPGLTDSQLMLMNDDLKPGKESLLFPVFLVFWFPTLCLGPVCFELALGMIIGRK